MLNAKWLCSGTYSADLCAQQLEEMEPHAVQSHLHNTIMNNVELKIFVIEVFNHVIQCQKWQIWKCFNATNWRHFMLFNFCHWFTVTNVKNYMEQILYNNLWMGNFQLYVRINQHWKMAVEYQYGATTKLHSLKPCVLICSFVYWMPCFWIIQCT